MQYPTTDYTPGQAMKAQQAQAQFERDCEAIKHHPGNAILQSAILAGYERLVALGCIKEPIYPTLTARLALPADWGKEEIDAFFTGMQQADAGLKIHDDLGELYND